MLNRTAGSRSYFPISNMRIEVALGFTFITLTAPRRGSVLSPSRSTFGRDAPNRNRYCSDAAQAARPRSPTSSPRDCPVGALQAPDPRHRATRPASPPSPMPRIPRPGDSRRGRAMGTSRLARLKPALDAGRHSKTFLIRPENSRLRFNAVSSAVPPGYHVRRTQSGCPRGRWLGHRFAFAPDRCRTRPWSGEYPA